MSTASTMGPPVTEHRGTTANGRQRARQPGRATRRLLQTVARTYRDNPFAPEHARAMDSLTDARRELMDCLQDLRDAEAKLTTLPTGSRARLLMEEAVARLSEAVDLAERNAARPETR
jgi:hypothetical protein